MGWIRVDGEWEGWWGQVGRLWTTDYGLRAYALVVAVLTQVIKPTLCIRFKVSSWLGKFNLGLKVLKFARKQVLSQGTSLETQLIS